MRRLASALLAACLPLVPGCMVLNAAISVGGLVAGGPAQYAGTAATICEYGYELAAHRRTPDEVLAGKLQTLAGLVEPERPETGAWETGLDRRDPEGPPRADLNLLADLYGVADLPDREPEPAAAPVVLAQGAGTHPAASSRGVPLAATLAGSRRAAPEVPGKAPAAPQAPGEAPAAPGPGIIAAALPDWPCLALVRGPDTGGQDQGWSVRLPVSQSVL